MGLPFLPVRGVLGSDYMRVREDFREMANPYDPSERVAVVPAILPDTAIFHAYQADREGNIMSDTSLNNKLLAQAARRAVIVTAEEVVDQLSWNPRRMFIPGHMLSAVVHAPGGAHPTACRGYYPVDSGHVRHYLSCAADEEKWKAYLENYVYGVRDHAEYCRLVNLDSLWERRC